MDITKDRLYCDAKESMTRKSTQSAMVLIAKSMLGLVAPVLTYTADEILDYAPAILKGDMQNVFDLVYEEIPEVAKSFDDVGLIVARIKFSEAIDKHKKEKRIKSALELEIAGDVDGFAIGNEKNLEDWFVVSGVKASSEGERVASFEQGGKTFTVHKATGAKCPRCWKFTSSSETCVCERCAKVVA